MKKLVLIFAVAITLLCGCGCGNESMSARDDVDAGADSYGTYEWISPDGVHYWIYYGNYKYGIAPRYDNDGNLVIDER